MLDKIRPLHWGFIIFLVWSAAILYSGILRLDPYQIDENAARALLMAWSVADRVINPIVVLGLPDFRVLLFFPLGLYWPGSILAAKVFMLGIAFLSVAMLYRWGREQYGEESARIASGLLLISPALLAQINTLDSGPFLLFTIAVGYWMHQRYMNKARPLGGWFFLQMLLIAISVSIHPAALAYPLALAWQWYRHPVDNRQQRHYLAGIGISVIVSLLLLGGWHNLSLFTNPLTAFSLHILPYSAEGEPSMFIGLFVLLPLAALLWLNRTSLLENLGGRMMMLAIIIGLFSADGGWVLLCLSGLLYPGSAALIRLNTALGKQGLAGQRGLVMVVILILATVFMQTDKAHYHAMQRGQLPDSEVLLMSLAAELDPLPGDEDIMVMSEWPGKTMLAVKRPVIPLPPASPDADSLMDNIRGTTHILFDPRNRDNESLRRHLAEKPDRVRTLAIQPGGVIIKLLPSS